MFHSCGSSRAIHLDVLPDLSTKTFITSFTRFIRRRGIPKVVVSENAQNLKDCCLVLIIPLWVTRSSEFLLNHKMELVFSAVVEQFLQNTWFVVSNIVSRKFWRTQSWVIVKKSSQKTCRPTVGQLSADSRLTVGRLLADNRPTGFARNIGYLSADSGPTVGRLLVMCR